MEVEVAARVLEVSLENAKTVPAMRALVLAGREKPPTPSSQTLLKTYETSLVAHRAVRAGTELRGAPGDGGGAPPIVCGR